MNNLKSLMKKKAAFVFLVLLNAITHAQDHQELLNFEFEEVSLNGVFNSPENTTPKGIVLIVHGSGRTNAVAQNWYGDVRATLVKAGYSTYMWDKMGCGKSGGTFNYNQSVYNSAAEVIAAITMLKEKQLPGSATIGLWGISRAGWINPIVINRYKDIAFWISVSGVDGKENFNYLLEKNLEINGRPKDSIDLILDELVAGTKISHSGGSYDAYMEVTPNLRKNPFWLRFTNGGITKEAYDQYQPIFMKEKLDEATGLQVYIPDFESILTTVRCPVLALFGEKDKNVDWEKTKALYEQTLTPNTAVTIRSFPDCNHNLFQVETGGFYEMQDHNLPYIRCDGFLKAIADWLDTME